MLKADIVGAVAAFCTTIAFLPQVIKIYRTGHARDLSLAMYLIFTFGVLCWSVFGILIRSLPVILANSITFVFCVYILSMKLKYR